jgi:hypothetical protein
MSRIADEGGSSAPAFIVFMVLGILAISFVVYVGRVPAVAGDLTNVAARAARAGSLMQTEAGARGEIVRVVNEAMQEAGLPCSGVGISAITPTADGVQLARGSTIEVTITCPLKTDDLAIGVPGGNVVVRGRAPVDVFREGQ